MSQYSSKLLVQFDQLTQLSSKQWLIIINFYLWEMAVRKGRMQGLWMGRKHIAKESSCSVSTVKRFFKECSALVDRKIRNRKSNLYSFNPDLYDAMKILDKHMLLKKSMKKFKKWVVGVYKDELKSSYENEKKWPSSTPILNPYPSLYPLYVKVPEIGAYISSQNESGRLPRNIHLDSLPLSNDEKKRIISFNFSEVVMIEGIKDYHWYSKRTKIRSEAGFLISRMKDYQRKSQRL